MDRIVKLFAAGSVMLAVPAAASAACWDEQSSVAAELRALEVMLMVSALRCRLDGEDFLPDYNRFVRVNRAVLTGAVDDLRVHFDEGDGWRPALDRFDRYVTAIANEHGDEGAYGCRELRLITHDAIDAGGDGQALLDLSRAVGVTPRFVGGFCRSGDGAGWTRAATKPAAAPAQESADRWAPVVSSVGVPPRAAARATPMPSPASDLPGDLPVVTVVDAPVAEPRAPAAMPVPAVMAAVDAPPVPRAATAVAPAPAGTAPAAAPRGAVFDLASGSLTVPDGGEIEVVVSETAGPEGGRSRTYRIRRPAD